MFESKKLRPDTSVTGIGQPVIALLLFAICWAVFGIKAGMLLFAFIFGIYATLSLVFGLRTGNAWFLVTMVYQLTIILFAMIVPKIGYFPVERDTFKPLILIVIVELAVLVYIMATKKLKWRGREILELAAMNISEATNGFTSRPKPLGKIDCSPNEIIGFSSYLQKKLIAFPFKETTRTVIVPIMMGEEYKLVLGFSTDYTSNTWVAFDNDGNVSAHISKKDYLKYKEALSFDQLCASLGNTFINFFEHYKKGEEVRIMHELNKINVGPFS
jgi:hypothetical protein